MKTYLDLSELGMSFTTEHGVFEALTGVNLKIEKGSSSPDRPLGLWQEHCTQSGGRAAGAEPGGIILDGREVDGPGPERAMVFQNHALLPWLSVHQNVELAVRRRVTGREEVAEQVHYFLSLVQMEHASHKMPHEISGA